MIRNKQIDGLRGITILMIMIFHIYYRYGELFMEKSSGGLRYLGIFGSTVFLLISSYFLNNNRKKKLVNFLFSKIIRLWPCYAVSITITWVVLHFFKLPGRMTTAQDYLANLVYVNGFLGKPYVDGAHWYITTLLAAILMVGVITCLRVENYPITYFVLFFFEGLSKVFGFNVLNIMLGSSYIGLICFGICIRKLKVQNYKYTNLFQFESVQMYVRKNQWFLTAVGCVIYYVARKGIVAALCLCLALPIFLGAVNNKFSVLDKKIPQHLAKISYPLYLIHQNIAYTIICHLSKIDSDYVWLWKFIAFIIVIILGEVLFFIAERPTQELICHGTH